MALPKRVQIYRRLRRAMVRYLKSPVVRKWPKLNGLTVILEREPVDAYLISFPKCGRTWLRLLLGWSIARHYDCAGPMRAPEPAVLDIERLSEKRYEIPRIVLEHDDDAFFKEANELTRSKKNYSQSKIIFLVRDPRDVIVSTYFHKKNRRNFMPHDTSRNKYASYEGSISEFLREPIGSFNTLLHYYNLWLKYVSYPDKFLLVSYEILIAEPEKELLRVLKFLGLSEISNSEIREAVEFASFKNMRKMEEENTFNTEILKPKLHGHHDTYKTRRGEVGGYLDTLREEDINYLNTCMASTLSEDYRNMWE